MNRTTIEWTDYTWNPVTGCHKVSTGCKNCYAEKFILYKPKPTPDHIKPVRSNQSITKSPNQ